MQRKGAKIGVVGRRGVGRGGRGGGLGSIGSQRGGEA